MKVSELIKQLQSYPQDAEVIVQDWRGCDEQSIADRTYFDKDREVCTKDYKTKVMDCVVIIGT